jgi:hypothetical protein
MTYRVYLRSHAPGEQGRIEAASKTNTANPGAAETAYRALLARDDLAGQPRAAVLSRNNRSVYFSRFDRELGEGRIHPDAPLDLFRDDDGTSEATQWHPDAAPHDWEQDERPLAECLKAWHGRPDWSRQRAANELRISKATYDGWCAGRPAENERAIRRMMTLIDGGATR